LSIKGYTVSARSIIDRAARMKPFFDGSGGGITLTGGEVTMQPEFAAAILAGCRALGIHTAIETCGACNWSTLQGLLEYTDLVLYDLKLVDDVAHRRWTGNSNQRILDNVARLTGHNVQVRVPLIPGITDTEGNLSAIYDIMRQAGLSAVALLPYNPSAAAKYEWFDRAYQIEGEPQNDDLLAHLAGMGCALGLDVTIG
jgi:pyruvate formate lyase activating enzyme